LSRLSCVGALGLTETGSSDPIASARAAFVRGLFRRGIAILNQALQEGTNLPVAWYLKSRFLNSVGFNIAATKMLDGVFARSTSATDRIWLLEEKSFLWSECGRGTEALGSADAAVELGSTSLRTHYLRGRALALLGRLEEARNEMNQVLTLDPNNADAQRAVKMIDAANKQTMRKGWWQFWKNKT
jgi:Flp pilus assembly protein TadD